MAEYRGKMEEAKKRGHIEESWDLTKTGWGGKHCGIFYKWCDSVCVCGGAGQRKEKVSLSTRCPTYPPPKFKRKTKYSCRIWMWQCPHLWKQKHTRLSSCHEDVFGGEDPVESQSKSIFYRAVFWNSTFKSRKVNSVASLSSPPPFTPEVT